MNEDHGRWERLEHAFAEMIQIERRHSQPTPGLALREPLPVVHSHDESFGRWLLAQRGRGDWIDGLATAARADSRFPRDGSPDDVRARLTEMGAEGDLFEQVDDAERCWESL